MLGVRRPRRRILGSAFAGEIEEVGKEAQLLAKGDQVFGTTGASLGAYADYVCMPEDGVLAMKPTNATFEEAAAVFFGAHTALFFLRDKGHIHMGQKVLINGASGSVGTAAVQLAKYYGAEVTGVCSATNLQLVKSLGADQVIDYTKEDFGQNGETYDLILDTVVGKTSFSHSRDSLEPNGVYLAVAGGLKELIQMLRTSVVGDKKVVVGPAPEHKEDLIFLKELIEAGKLRPLIDRSYPLEQIAEAHSYVDKGHKKGNVVITVEQGAKT